MQELRLLRCPNDGDIGTLGVYRVTPAKLRRPVHAKGQSAIMECRYALVATSQERILRRIRTVPLKPVHHRG